MAWNKKNIERIKHDMTGLRTQKINLKELNQKTILVTGATGLIGSCFIHSLVNQMKAQQLSINIIAIIRNEDKARRVLGDCKDSVKYICADVTTALEIPETVDYIVHAASQTSSKAFIENPIETINTAISGTINVLQLAREKAAKKVVFLSTMEVYGSPDTDEKIDEEHYTNLNTMMARSSYPESKRMCENLCVSYMKEYGVPINVIRLTQTFGPGVEYNDGRVFAEFARCAIENRNIVLHTKGETKRNYLYTEDAVSAILTVLLKGKSGEAYNAANEATYCSIYEMAEIVSSKCANGKIKVELDIGDESKYGYAPVLKMNLDTRKLQRLGWKPTVGLEEMFCNLISDMQNRRV